MLRVSLENPIASRQFLSQTRGARFNLTKGSCMSNKDEFSQPANQESVEPVAQRFEQAFPTPPAEKEKELLEKNLQQQIDTLNQALKESREKEASYWERLLRKEADIQNMHKRNQQEVENARKFAVERFAHEMLQILDSLEQGLNFSQQSVSDLMEGMKLTRTLLLNIFEKQGINILNPQGEWFDPNYHEAISMQETAEVEPNRIVHVVQKGYVLNNRLLRAARVVVAKMPIEQETT